MGRSGECLSRFSFEYARRVGPTLLLAGVLTEIAAVASGAPEARADSPRLARWHLAESPTNPAEVVREPALAEGGRARFRFDTGAVRVEYRPDWSSQDRMAPPGYGWGQGPGRWVTLFEAGAAGEGSFALAIDPAGTNLVFTTRDVGGVTRTNLQARISWTYPQPQLRRRVESAPWREVALNYTPGFCTLLVDGVQQGDWQTRAAVGAGVHLPRLRQRRDVRLAIGANLTEDASPAGLIGAVETFAEPLTPMHSQPLLARTVLSANVEVEPPSVTLRWAGLPGPAPTVRRRPWGETNWLTLGGRPVGNAFTDREPLLRPGQVWEYAVGERFAVVALNRPPVERRGGVLVLVDETLARRLEADLDRFSADLRGDGWQVVRRPAPRHDDRAWDRGPISPRYIESVRRVKSLIRAEYDAPGGLAAVVLVGHVTIPYSGIGYEDGHFDHNGAWPADSYYGDLDQEWPDSTINTASNISHPPFRNVPGDGKFDPYQFRPPGTPDGGGLNGLEVMVGRIDFANLPAFRPDGELELLRRYFDKNHRYRMGELTFADRAVVGGFFYSSFNPDSLAVYQNGAWTLSRLFGPEWDGIRMGDGFAPGVSALWGFQGGYGSPDTLHNNPAAASAQGIAVVSAATLAARASGPAVGFLVVKGSYFGDWNLAENNFLRSALAVRDGGLASLWTRDLIWRTEGLAVGEPLGNALLLSARDHASTRTTFILGDPTLRLAVVPPPRELKAARSAGSVRLTWSPAESGTSFHVYRSAAESGPFARLNAAPLSETDFADESAGRGRRFYQVRSLVLTTTGAGAYTNLSQAAVVTVE